MAWLLTLMLLIDQTQPMLTTEGAKRLYLAGLSTQQEQLKARGYFRQAAIILELNQHQQHRQQSAALCQMRAQAWWLAGDHAAAIAAYRHGLQLFPNDVELRNGLEFARNEVTSRLVGDLAAASQPPPMLTAWLPLPVWCFHALCGVGIVISAGIFLTDPSGLKSRLISGCIFILSVGVALLLWNDINRSEQQWLVPYVIMKQPARLYLGNSYEYPTVTEQPLPSGVEMDLLDERGGWVKVRLTNGQSGWVPVNAVIVGPALTLHTADSKR